MKPELKQLLYKVNDLIEGGEILLLLDDIKHDISKQIMTTKPEDGLKREELYYMSYGISLLERKMMEMVNEISQENE